MDIKAVIKEVLIMGVLLMIIVLLGVFLFYKYIPKTVDNPETSVYKRAEEIEEALEDIAESSTDTSILNTYTGQTIYQRDYDHGKVNPFDRSPNELYMPDNTLTSTGGNTTNSTSGSTSSGSSSSSSGTNTTNTSSGGKLTNTTTK